MARGNRDGDHLGHSGAVRRDELQALGLACILFLLSWMVAFASEAKAAHRQFRDLAGIDPHEPLNGLLLAATRRLDHLVGLNTKKSPKWYWDEYQRLDKQVYELPDQYLGGEIADEYSEARNTDSSPHGFMEWTKNQSDYLHALLGRLDSLSTMQDWVTTSLGSRNPEGAAVAGALLARSQPP
jgi:hypothetical protein